MKRIPSLDGLRALSILLVIIGHVAGMPGVSPNLAILSRGGFDAALGVRVFFVISGFLITHLLIGEQAKTGSISLPHFYLRRTLRIFPASYTLLIVVAVAAHFGVFELRPGDLLAGFTYTMNYHPDRAWTLGHLWSLSVEEQFYLIWPLTIKLLGPQRAKKTLIGVMVGAPILRLILNQWTQLDTGEFFPTVADALATGCLLALVREDLPKKIHPLVPALMLGAVVVASKLPYRLKIAGGETMMNVAIAVVVYWVVTNPTTWVGRFLNTRVIAGIGVLSYALYLLQQLFFNRHAANPLPVYIGIPGLFAAALALHFCIEKPFMRLRR
jgi:peptidoglycan/LPS O-acetylase OafA/YrhL